MKFAIISKMNILKKSHKQKGDAIIAVLCILAILLALSAALLVSTNIIVSNNAEYKDQVQCKLAANSFARTMHNKLGTKDDELTMMIQNLLNNGWTYYNEEISDHGHSVADKNFTVEDGEITHEIVMYYEADEITADKPELFELVLEQKTNYKKFTYKIVSRFSRVEIGENEYQWYLSGSSNSGSIK